MPFDIEFETVQKTAARLGLTERAVQKHAAAGKIPGAKRHGRVWMIPCSYVPAPKAAAAEHNGIPDAHQITSHRRVLPLLQSAYSIGRVMEHIHAMPDEDDRQIALAEYYFFSGNAEEAAKIAETYMSSHDPTLRLSANLIGAFANIGQGHIHMARFAMDNLQRQVSSCLHDDAPLQWQAIGIFVATAVSVLLHLRQLETPPLEEYLGYLPEGLKLYACYLLAHKAYLGKDYGKCLTIAEISLALCPTLFPIAAIYMHIIAAMALICMKRSDEARAHMDKAWKMAEPDGLIHPFGQHREFLQGMIEVYFRRAVPDVLPRIVEITYAFSAGWRKIHDSDGQPDMGVNLSTTEFTIAMLHNHGWLAQEIADHMDLSVRTVNRHIASVYEKLGISERNMLGQFLLQ